MTSGIDIVRRVVGPVLVLVLVVLGAGVAGAATTTTQPGGYLGGSSDQGPVDVNPSVVVPADSADPPVAESRALALTGTDVAVTMGMGGAALVVVGLFVAGGARLVSRRR
jgi:hypothetical protein